MFSEEWEERFRENKSISIWPWSDVISNVNRHVKIESGVRVLELGCGVGANIPFFDSIKADYFAIEGSKTAVNSVVFRFPYLAGKIAVGDFTKEIPFDGRFDLILDRSSVTHNDSESIKRCLNIIAEKLEDDGVYIGIDWFSAMHREFNKGAIEGEENTRTFTTGQFAGCGKVHFSDIKHIQDLFADTLIIKHLEHKTNCLKIPPDGCKATWNIIAKKKWK